MQATAANPSQSDDTFVSLEDLSQLERLDVLSRRVVDGILAGRHVSKLKGGSAEFTEHRVYTPGDEIRTIDWKVYAKSDRYYIKQYIEQTCLHVYLVTDCSGSMAFQWKHPGKFDYARAISVCLARLILRQGDAVGMAASPDGEFSFLPSRSNPNHFQIVLDRLRRWKPQGEVALSTTLSDLLKRLKRRGLVIILSDAFEDLAPLRRALTGLRLRGHDVVFFHILAPEEIAFQFDGWSRFENLETNGHHVDLDPALMRSEYMDRMKRFLDDLQKMCGQTGCDYVPLLTDQPVAATLSFYLKRRNARLKRG